MSTDLFIGYAAKAIPAPVRRKQERAEKIEVKALSPLEQKMREKERLSRSYRAWRRQVVKEVLASEPRLAGFLRYLRTVNVDRAGELIDAVEVSDWLRAAPQPVRIFALRMIDARSNRINQQLGNAVLDDPIPPETSVYFEARRLLHEGGRA